MTSPSAEERLQALFRLTSDLDGLKHVERQNPLSVGQQRLERTAEHCWHVAMATLLWAPHSPEPVDVGRAVTLAVVHDFPELFVGDTPVWSEEIEHRPRAELEAMTDFVDGDQTGRAHEIFEGWIDYERGASPEARLVMAVDILLPVFHNHARLDESSWRRYVVPASKVYARIESVRPVLPWLASRADDCVAEAVAHGSLAPLDHDG